jgi:hypothetical protein
MTLLLKKHIDRVLQGVRPYMETGGGVNSAFGNIQRMRLKNRMFDCKRNDRQWCKVFNDQRSGAVTGRMQSLPIRKRDLQRSQVSSQKRHERREKQIGVGLAIKIASLA